MSGRFSHAFQPIVDVQERTVVSYEALVRGPHDEPAGRVFAAVPDVDVHRFDEELRGSAIRMASRLDLPCRLNLNFLPHSLELSPRSLERTLEAADGCGLPISRLVLEVTEGEAIADHAGFATLLNSYRRQGLQIAIDDFGAGHAGLNLLAALQPDQLKLDMLLVRSIETSGPRQAIVRAVHQLCVDLGIDVLAEGVETLAEYRWLRDEGVSLFQGYLFGKPGFERLPAVRLESIDA